MNEEALRQLVAAYWKHWASGRGNRQQRLDANHWSWAWIKVQRAVDEPSPEVLEILAALVNSAPDDAALAYIGAGPLEDLINEHAEKFIGQIEQLARKDPAFRKSLANVWLSGSLPMALRERLARFGSSSVSGR